MDDPVFLSSFEFVSRCNRNCMEVRLGCKCNSLFDLIICSIDPGMSNDSFRCAESTHQIDADSKTIILFINDLSDGTDGQGMVQSVLRSSL
jgi:hypothetical protein